MKLVFKHINSSHDYKTALAVLFFVFICLSNKVEASIPATPYSGTHILCAGQTAGYIWGIEGFEVIYPVADNTDTSFHQTCSEQVAQPTHLLEGDGTYAFTSGLVYGNAFAGIFTRIDPPDGVTREVTTGSSAYIYDHISYSCPDPTFSELNESNNTCGQPSSCSDDTSPFISQTPQEQICVTNPDSGTSCNYFTELGQYGNFTGVFANSGQSCECANMPNGSCETLAEPILPEGEDCTIFGTERWCTSDPSQCDGGSLDDCSNCGTVNGTFMCSDGSAPEGDYCYSGSGRAECEGVPDGYCPTGYACDPLDKEQPDTDDTDEIDQPNCTAPDTRPECQGVPDGGKPVKSEETAQLEFTNKQLQALNDNVQQGNKNTAANNRELIEIKKNTAALVDDIQTDEDRAQLDSELAAKKASNLQAMTDSLNSTAERDALSTSSTSLFSSLNDSITGSLVPTAVCTDIIIQLPSSSNSVTLPVCTVSTYVRPILAWIFMIVAVIYARRKIFKAVSEVNV